MKHSKEKKARKEEKEKIRKELGEEVLKIDFINNTTGHSLIMH